MSFVDAFDFLIFTVKACGGGGWMNPVIYCKRQNNISLPTLFTIETRREINNYFNAELL